MSNRISFFSLFFISLVFTACAEADLTTTVTVPQSYDNATATTLSDRPNGGEYQLSDYLDLTLTTTNEEIEIAGNNQYLKMTVAGGGFNRLSFTNNTQITGLDVNSDQNTLTLNSNVEVYTRLVVAGSYNQVTFNFDSALYIGGNYNRPARFAILGDQNTLIFAEGALYDENISFEIGGSDNYICAPIGALVAWGISSENRKIYDQGNCNIP